MDLKFFPLQISIGTADSPYIYRERGEYSLDLQDKVGTYLVKAIGLLSSFYHLFYSGTRPDLQQFQLDNEQELEILSLRVSQVYDFLAQENPDKIGYYQLQCGLVFLECDDSNISQSSIGKKEKSSLALS